MIDPPMYGGFQKLSWKELLEPQRKVAGIFRQAVGSSTVDVAIHPLQTQASSQAGAFAESPRGFSLQESYKPANLAWYRVARAIVHGSAGIVATSPYVVSQTMAHTDPTRHRYAVEKDGSINLLPKRLRAVRGLSYSMLHGAYTNYYHWMLDSVARLAAIRQLMETRPGILLVPPLEDGFRRQTMDLLKWIDPRNILEMDPDEALLTERVVVPDTVSGGGWVVSPNIAALFSDMMTHIGHGPMHPRRFYIDRSGSGNRAMTNENDLIAALRPFGIIPVKLELMAVADQARLFSTAELVIASHGAGLSNLLFASSSCHVVEIFMSSYVNWCFRVIAAARAQTYDAVICDADTSDAHIHRQTWRADIQQVIAATRRIVDNLACIQQHYHH